MWQTDRIKSSPKGKLDDLLKSFTEIEKEQGGGFKFEKILDRKCWDAVDEDSDSESEQVEEEQCDGSCCPNAKKFVEEMAQRAWAKKMEYESALNVKLAMKKQEQEEERKRKEAHERAKSQEWTIPDWVLNEDKKRQQKRDQQEKKKQKAKKQKSKPVSLNFQIKFFKVLSG